MSMGDKTLNASWIALVTGLGRKEVSRILGVPPMLEPSVRRRGHPANKVLDAWHKDRAFAVGDRPKILPLKGGRSTRHSFWTLATRYAPDVYPGLLLRELCRMGAAVRLKGGRVQVRKRRYKAWELYTGYLRKMNKMRRPSRNRSPTTKHSAPR